MKNLAKVYSAELDGIAAKLIEVEVDINIGLHYYTAGAKTSARQH